MRLIDADVLIDELKQSALHHCNNPREDSLLQRDRVIVRAQPTVEAIPVTEKAFEMFETDYKNRLKADMVAMLTELQLEIEEKGIVDFEETYVDNGECIISVSECNRLIQQKINELKGEGKQT